MKQPRKTPLDLYIEQKQAEKAAAVRAYEEADQLIERLMIEIAALEKARAAINMNAQKISVGSAGDFRNQRRRSISVGWKKVLRRIGDKGELGATTDEILAFCNAEGIDLKRPTLRAQLSNYVTKHRFLEKTPTGTFALTKMGHVIAYVRLRSEKEAEEAEAPR